MKDLSPASDAAIRLDDVHLTLGAESGEVNILRGIDLVAQSGEALGIVGPSGSGKTSMLMVIAGLERATSGSVSVAGKTLDDMREDNLALFRRKHVGIVFQAFHLIPTMTALENVAIPMELAGLDDAFERARAELEAVGLGHRLGHYPGQLSGGEQQRTALARAFAIEPDILLADEPTGNLDGETGEQIVELMFRLRNERGSTLMLITHDPALAGRCDRTLTLADGRIAGEAVRAVA
ncbi:MAG: ABC transporter ATP-binding protein [Rhodospirillales bacterium]